MAPSPSVDVTYVVDELRLGRVNRPTSTHRVPGGKGVNTARAAHALGADVHAVTLLGGATGRWIVEALRAGGPPLRHIDVAAPTRTCVSLAEAARTSMTDVYEPSGPVTPAEWDALVRLVDDTLRGRGGWATVSGSVPPGAGSPTEFAAVARRHGARLAVDLHGTPLRAALGAGVAVVKVNVDEARDALDAGTSADPAELAAALARCTTLGAVVTAGVDGAWAARPDGGGRHVRSAHRGSFPVGSGDCLLAGLVVALDAGADLLDALLEGVAAATANALRPGAAVFTMEDVRRVRDEVNSSDH